MAGITLYLTGRRNNLPGKVNFPGGVFSSPCGSNSTRNKSGGANGYLIPFMSIMFNPLFNHSLIALEETRIE